MREISNQHKRGIKISLTNETKCFCSECFNTLDRSSRYCWYCGCILKNSVHGGTFEEITNYRECFIKDGITGYEEDN